MRPADAGSHDAALAVGRHGNHGRDTDFESRDSRRLAERTTKAGVEVRLDVFPELQHVFHFSAGQAPEADEAIRKLAEWVRPKLGLA